MYWKIYSTAVLSHLFFSDLSGKYFRLLLYKPVRVSRMLRDSFSDDGSFCVIIIIDISLSGIEIFPGMSSIDQ